MQNELIILTELKKVKEISDIEKINELVKKMIEKEKRQAISKLINYAQQFGYESIFKEYIELEKNMNKNKKRN